MINYFCDIIKIMDLLLKYFPELTQDQLVRFSKLQELYKDWNLKINVVTNKRSLYKFNGKAFIDDALIASSEFSAMLVDQEKAV